MQTSPARKLILIVVLFSALLAGCAMPQLASTPNAELKLLLNDVEKLNHALKQDPRLLSGTRLRDLDLSGMELDGVVLEGLNWTNIKLNDVAWSNIRVTNSAWRGVQFKNSRLEQVRFVNVTMNIEPETWRSNTSFIQSVFKEVYFQKSKLINVKILSLRDSDITFDNTQVIREKVENYHHIGVGALRYLQAEIKIINGSVLDTGLVSHTKYPSEVILENIKLIGGISGELKRLEIHDSQYYGRGGDRADYVFIENSTVDTGFINSRFVHLKNNAYLEPDGKSLPYTGLIEVEHAVLEGCKNPIRMGMVHDTHVQNLHVRDCTIIEPYLSRAHVGRFDLCNSVLEVDAEAPDSRRTVWDGSQIAELNFYNTRFEGELPAIEDLQIGTLGSDGKHPVPAQLQQAADAQKSLGDCPPLPDVDALREKALKDTPPPELSSLFY